MTLETGPYYNLNDRLDVLASSNFNGTDADEAVASIVAANPEWDGLQYLSEAFIPASVTSRPPENLRQVAKSLKAQLVSDVEPNLEDFDRKAQFKSDSPGLENAQFADAEEAAWWSAQVRVLMPKGSLYGDAQLGTTLLRDTLESPISSATLTRLENRAQAALNIDTEWYSVRQLNGEVRPPTIIELMARLQLQPFVEEPGG